MQPENEGLIDWKKSETNIKNNMILLIVGDFEDMKGTLVDGECQAKLT